MDQKLQVKDLIKEHQAKCGSAGNKELLVKLRELLAKEKEREAQAALNPKVQLSSSQLKLKTGERKLSNKVNLTGQRDKDHKSKSCLQYLMQVSFCVITIILTFTGLGVIIKNNLPDDGKEKAQII